MYDDHYDEMLRILRETPNPASLDARLGVRWTDETFSEALAALIAARGVSATATFERAVIERSTGYKILSGARKPGRDLVLRIALALHLPPSEAQYLLRLANRGALTPLIRRDAAILYGLVHKRSLDQVQELLIEYDEAPLFGDD